MSTHIVLLTVQKGDGFYIQEKRKSVAFLACNLSKKVISTILQTSEKVHDPEGKTKRKK